MNIVAASMFRDSTGYIGRYASQIQDLNMALRAHGDTLRVIAVENDSTDDTWARLNHPTVYGTHLVRVHDDCPYWPSVDDPARWRHIAWVCNHVLERVDDRDDVLVYVESDLIWDSPTILRLIDHLKTVDAVSCPNMRGDVYYDTWGSRKDGARFTSHTPHHPALVGGELVEMDSVASILAVHADIARKTRFQPKDGFVGWCRDIRSQGFKIWLDPTLKVEHP